MSHFGLLITSAFFGNAAYRDFKENIHSIYFTYPIKRIHYFAGKFSGAFASTLFIFSGTGIGALIACFSPFVHSEKIGQINLFAFFQPYLIGVIPNILFAGALFFSLALLTRKIFAVYVGSIVILMGYMIGLGFAQSLDSHLIASLIDPYGLLASQNLYKYWTAAQKNVLIVSLAGDFLYNRILWSAAGFAVLIIAYKKFHFSYMIDEQKLKIDIPKSNVDHRTEILREIKVSIKAVQVFKFKTYIQQMLYTMFNEFTGMVKNIYFLSILIFAFIFIFVQGFQNVGLYRGTQTYPVTYQVLDITANLFYLFVLIIIIYCSGEFIWRERDNKVQGIFDSLPVPEWVPFTGKLGALILIQVLMMLIIMVSGIIIQILHGYYQFEFGLYFKELFGIRLVFFSLIAVFAMLVQVIVNNKFSGHFIMAVLYMIVIDEETLPAFGFEHNLYRFAGTPAYIYSDMNGYGLFAKPLLFFNLYWSIFAVLLIMLSVLFWVRGNDVSFKDRIKILPSRITKLILLVSGTGLFSCIVVGGYIFYNTNILNRFEPIHRIDKMQVDYEKKFKKYENTPQPRVIDVNLSVDIYPYQKRVKSTGSLLLENKTEYEIKDVFVQMPRIAIINKLSLEMPNSLKESAKEHGIYIFKLNQSMKPGAQQTLDFDLEFAEKGFKNHISYSGYENMILVENGTLIDFLFLLPAINYDPYNNLELVDNRKRNKYGLSSKDVIAAINDEKARMNYMVKDADWINFEAVVSTSKDQIALTSGELLGGWVESERHYFHYKTREKILKSFAVVSAKYSVKKDNWQDVAIEVYYHKDHEYNIDLMINAIKKSLEYYTENFSPYQFKQIKIVEYPRYKTGAEAYPYIIPFSEGHGFIAKFDNTNVPYVFRITAHEVGHQWWAYQVIGANVEGEFLLSEVLSQYSALMVVKNEYDQNKINTFIQDRIKGYLRGRGRETKKEVPLALTNLSAYYVNYEKGIVVMNALQDYIGEEKLNAAIRKYINKVAFQEPPYTTSLEFLQYVMEATPDSLKYIIKDMFESITLYENKAVKATHEELAKGKYQVQLTFEAKKLRADEIGNETSIKLNDYITFGVFGVDGKELYLKKHLVNSERGVLEFVIDEVPVKAGIDPYYYLIDKKTDDNIVNTTPLIIQ